MLFVIEGIWIFSLQLFSPAAGVSYVLIELIHLASFAIGPAFYTLLYFDLRLRKKSTICSGALLPN